MNSSDASRFNGLTPVGFLASGEALPPLPFAGIDVETTGLRPRNDRVIELAVVRCDPSGSPISEWSTLVDPGRDPGPTRIHGITPADLVGAPTFAEALPDLLHQLGDAIVVAHNLPFDSAFFANEFRRAGVEPHRGYGLCTLELARIVLADQSGFSLAACAESLGIAHLGAHRALADTRVTALLLQALISRISPDAHSPAPVRLTGT